MPRNPIDHADVDARTAFLLGGRAATDGYTGTGGNRPDPTTDDADIEKMVESMIRADDAQHRIGRRLNRTAIMRTDLARKRALTADERRAMSSGTRFKLPRN